MVQTCCVKNCKNRQKRGINISFHQFPKNPEIKKQWINAIKHDSFVHSPHLRICSKHFTADQFEQSPWSSRQVLRANAIPNKELPVVMLNEPEPKPEPDVPETQHIEGRDVPSVSRIETENESTSMDEENLLLEKPVRKKRKIYVGDFKAQDCTSDKENYLQILNTTLEKKTKQVKRLHEKNRRLIKKINDLQSLVDDLRKKNMITEDVSVILSDNLPVSTKTLFKQIMQSRLKTYPTELKTFAVTLNFYSPRAYNYVRKTFNNLLPHPRAFTGVSSIF